MCIPWSRSMVNRPDPMSRRRAIEISATKRNKTQRGKKEAVMVAVSCFVLFFFLVLLVETINNDDEGGGIDKEKSFPFVIVIFDGDCGCEDGRT